MLDGSETILIAGGGIGGLTLALALARWGRRSRILEARSELSEAGAGIQLGPNATRLLGELGVGESLAQYSVSPQSIEVREAESGRHLAELPLGEWISARHGSPYWVLHRADLQRCLVAAANASPLIELSYGFRVASVAEDAHGVSVSSDPSEEARGAILVGADGIWSGVRNLVEPNFDLRFAGTTAARAIIPMSDVPEALRGERTGVWLAPSAHIVHYPVRAGAALAIVVITAESQPEQGWGIPWPAEAVLAKTTSFDLGVRELLGRAENWHRWALFNPRPLQTWSKGRITLLGDAAHPILPFLAQGGAMAIEDAVVLAWEIARGYGTHAHVFDAYETQRRGRIQHVQKASRDNGTAYHLSGFAAGARNLALNSTPGGLLMQRYDWIYGWHHDMEFGEVAL